MTKNELQSIMTMQHWETSLKESGLMNRSGDIELLAADKGEYLTFCRTVGRKVKK